MASEEDSSLVTSKGTPIAELRVIDIKRELDERGLSKSGSKTQLTDRLKAQLLLEKLQQDAAQSSGDEHGEGKVPNMALQDDKAGQNEFVRQYLQQQQKNLEIQMEVKKQVEEERKRKSADESSADESVSKITGTKPKAKQNQNRPIEVPVHPEMTSPKKFKVDDSNAPVTEGTKMPRPARKSSRNASRVTSENGQEVENVKTRSRSPTPESERIRERTRSGSSSSSRSPSPGSSSRGRRGRPGRGRAKRGGGGRSNRKARKDSPSSSRSSSPEEVLPKKKRRSTNSRSSRSKSRSPPKVSPELPTRRSSRRSCATPKDAPGHDPDTEIPGDGGDVPHKQEEDERVVEVSGRADNSEPTAILGTKQQVARGKASNEGTGSHTPQDSLIAAQENSNFEMKQKGDEIGKQECLVVPLEQQSEETKRVTATSDDETNVKLDTSKPAAVEQPTDLKKHEDSSHLTSTEEKPSGGRLSRWKSRSRVQRHEKEMLPQKHESVGNQGDTEAETKKECLGVKEPSKDIPAEKLAAIQASMDVDTESEEDEKSQSRVVVMERKSSCEEKDNQSEGINVACPKISELQETPEDEEKDNRNSKTAANIPQREQVVVKQRGTRSSDSSSRSRSRSASPKRQKKSTSSSPSGTNSSSPSSDAETRRVVKTTKIPKESSVSPEREAAECKSSPPRAVELKARVEPAQDGGGQEERLGSQRSQPDQDSITSSKKIEPPSEASAVVEEPRGPQHKVEESPQQEVVSKTQGSVAVEDEHPSKEKGPAADEKGIDNSAPKKDKGPKRRKWGSKTSKAAKTTKRTTSIEISSDSLKGLIGEVKLTETVFDMETEVVNDLDYEPEDDRRDIKVKRTIVQSAPKEEIPQLVDVEDARKVEAREKEGSPQQSASPIQAGSPAPETEKKIIRLSSAPMKEGGKKKLKEGKKVKKKKESEWGEKEIPTENKPKPKETKLTATTRTTKPILPVVDEPEPVRAGSKSPARNPLDRVVRIAGLVRPFTVNQLKELLRRSGELDDEHFWISGIKSHCLVAYKNVEDAQKARAALHGTRWPQSNPKILIVDFAKIEDVEHRKAEDAGITKVTAKPQENKQRKEQQKEDEEKERRQKAREQREKERDEKNKEARNRRDQEREKRREAERKNPVREWDRDKIQQLSRSRSRSKTRDRPARRSRSRSRERAMGKRREQSRDKKEEEKRKDKKAKDAKAEEEPPAKLLDDLFRKTKAAPCIYWLPLTEEQALQRQTKKDEQEKEREKRKAAMEEKEKEEQKKREAMREERQKERERERIKEREREKSRERERDRDRGRHDRGGRSSRSRSRSRRQR